MQHAVSRPFEPYFFVVYADGVRGSRWATRDVAFAAVAHARAFGAKPAYLVRVTPK